MNVFEQPATRIEYRCRAIFLFLSQPVIAWTAWKLMPLPGPWYATQVDPSLAAAGLVLAVLGTWIRIQSASYFSSVKVARPDPMTDQIVQSGPFRVIRNPLYLGSWVWFIGFGICFGWIPAVVFSALHVWRYQRVVMLEERLLRSEFGDSFDDYCRRVPRWIPRRPWALLYGSRWTTGAVLGNAPFLGMCVGMAVSLRTGHMLSVLVGELTGFTAAAAWFLLLRETK